MKISPLEIRQHEFEKTFRGYSIEDVDNFLSTISQEWERVLNESKMLRMQLEIAEKEANKLREIEMTLFKTLKTAEDTSNLITEQASQQAEKYIQESKFKSEQVLEDAQNQAAKLVREAEEKAKQIRAEATTEVRTLERDYNSMLRYKENLTVQLRSLANNTLDQVERFETNYEKSLIFEKEEAPAVVENTIVEAPENIVVAEPVEEMVEQIAEPAIEETIAPVDEIAIEEEAPVAEVEELVEETVAPVAVEQEVATEPIKMDVDNLEIIEGIGPKISDLLNEAGIYKFRQLAITPVFKVREILENAGSHYASHDPSTWVEQALLAAEGRWDELDALKIHLIRGRHRVAEEAATVHEEEIVVEDVAVIEETPVVEEVKPIEETIVEQIEEQQPQEVFEIPTEIEPEIIAEETPEIENSIIEEVEQVKEEAPVAPPVNNLDGITEEMLEKVNKIKFAIRKAMSEKSDSAKDNTPLPTLRDVVGKQNEGGSFFDNI